MSDYDQLDHDSMELRQIHYFVAVAEELHFARAAERLDLAQPALSKQIRQLERELGVQLFERTTRSVALTNAGSVLLEEGRRILAQVDRARELTRQAQRGEIGELRIGFITSAGYDLLPELLQAYHARFPQVEIKPLHMTVDDQIEALQDRRLHIGVLRPPVRNQSIALEVIRREPLVLALPEAHPLARQDAIAVTALAAESFIVPPRGPWTGGGEAVPPLFQQAGFRPRVVQEAPDILTILGLVAASVGIAVVPATASKLRTSAIVYRPLAGNVPLYETALAWRRDEESPVLEGFIKMAREVASHLPEPELAGQPPST